MKTLNINQINQTKMHNCTQNVLYFNRSCSLWYRCFIWLRYRVL